MAEIKPTIRREFEANLVGREGRQRLLRERSARVDLAARLEDRLTMPLCSLR